MSVLDRLYQYLAPKPIDWNARLEADRAERERLIGRPYAKRRQAALKGLRKGAA